MTRRPPRTESPATDAAVALLTQLVRLGVRDAVLAPGSRSQALALAAAEFERLGLLRLRVRIDERVAGFLALGLAAETGMPVPVITTSGTAVANLHPAVLEAHHSGVPLILLTADRPERLRGIAANQTTTQPGLFADAVHWERDVPAPTGADGELDAVERLATEAFAEAARGPVHLNLAYDEPLSAPLHLDPALVEMQESGGDADGGVPIGAASGRRLLHFDTGAAGAAEPLALRAEPGTVVVAGTGAGEQAEDAARALGAPLLAEVSSGAHFGPNLVVAYRELLRDPGFGGAVRRAIVFGHPTLSREVPALLQRDDVEVIVVRGPGAEDFNPGRRVRTFADVVRVDGDPDPDRSWAGRWVAASRSLLQPEEQAPDITLDLGDHVLSELAAVRAPVTRRALAEAVWKATWPHDRLVLAASRLIREVDRTATGKKVRVHANRGLAGIDGTVATGLGIALASQDGEARGTTRVLLGDLALLHDAGSLLFGAGETGPRIQVIVGDDGGGTIFDGLEVASQAGPGFDRVMLTAQ
ncbi:MAG TPA: 2-succinyl-5-enolpyruvyl-6-hydroxy-3-cyclohexene-1-carboxylic-acid synthase, partial [Rhodoglobus sp.]|nr:2-succinyl-5-enolpyruvyl-6-hydroxy-3-cyclohexene-1-carboxylic-acid synthase [Rhodoglobus sp.]